MIERANGNGKDSEEGDSILSRRSYRRLLSYSILSVTLVSVIPLVIMMWFNYSQYEQLLHKEQTRAVVRLTTNAKHSLDFFLSERLSALSLIIREKSLEELKDPQKLERLLGNLKHSFGGFVDLGLIDGAGDQISYTGPYKLQGKNYEDQDWFHEVSSRGGYVSDVFKGYRNFPHFVVAVRNDARADAPYVLRATIESEVVSRPVLGLAPRTSGDSFLVNREGILQTPSRHHGAVLDRVELPSLPFSNEAEVIEQIDESGTPLIVGYAFVQNSPFIVVLITKSTALGASWLSLRRDLVGILMLSIILIFGVVVSGSVYMVRRIRETDIRRAAVQHKMEYTNRMAVLGRLAAGVAHEINNPLSIINEKAGLLDDLLRLKEEPPSKEKIISLVESVLKSVERCSTITHRLLGFAKHMDVRIEKIDMGKLLTEVLGFLEKEAHYRDLDVRLDIPDDLPRIESDRGQLQQLFLNIINNAFAAVEDGGKIEISAGSSGEEVEVGIGDDGVGIPKENLRQIFEPFFTTKSGYGTGLGLSITYGIVQKLGGHIDVDSELNRGTRFTVTLPVKRKET